MEEIIAAIVGNPIIRTFVEGLVVRVVAEVLHRRATDPNYLAKSDAVFSQLAAAKTDQERTDAQIALRNLMAG